MKRLILILFSLAVVAVTAMAQPRAIGIRVGGNAELSYQHSMQGDNFIEADFGMYLFSPTGMHLTGVYDFVFANIDNFNFYAGPGVSLGLVNHKVDDRIDTSFALGIAGQAGAEWQIGRIPLNVSLDWRPCWDFIGGRFMAGSVAIGARYRF